MKLERRLAKRVLKCLACKLEYHPVGNRQLQGVLELREQHKQNVSEGVGGKLEIVLEAVGVGGKGSEPGRVGRREMSFFFRGRLNK